jgi:hypothetical protein
MHDALRLLYGKEIYVGWIMGIHFSDGTSTQQNTRTLRLGIPFD